MNRIIILAIMLGSITVSPGGSAEEVQPEIKASGYTQDRVRMVIAIFRKACTPLGDNEYWSDIAEIRADRIEEIDRSRSNRGWKAILHLQLRISDKPRNLPEYYEGGVKLAGETLHYHLGGGKTPGFFGIKRMAQLLCSQKVDPSGADVFTDVAEMAVVHAVPIMKECVSIKPTGSSVSVKRCD